MNHVIKFNYEDGVKLDSAITWCGEKIDGFHFIDAQHAALAAGDNTCVSPCYECLDKIVEDLENGMHN